MLHSTLVIPFINLSYAFCPAIYASFLVLKPDLVICFLFPFTFPASKQYYDIYLNCILTLLKDYFLLINDYNTEVKVDVTKLNQINFIEIKDS